MKCFEAERRQILTISDNLIALPDHSDAQVPTLVIFMLTDRQADAQTDKPITLLLVYVYRVIITVKFLMIAEGTPQQLTSLEYKLHSTSTGVCITCTFLDSSTTDCVVVVHQQISQLSSSGLMNIESSHKFNRSASSDTVYGCIEGVNMEQYHIGVINGKRIIPITEPSGTINCVDIHTCIVHKRLQFVVSDKDSSLAGTIVGAGKYLYSIIRTKRLFLVYFQC